MNDTTDGPIHRITFLGGGIVGLIVAGSLATRGHDVGVLTRGHHAEAIRQSGLTIREQDGREWVAPALFATDDIAELAARPTDLVVFSCKAFDTESLSTQWAATGGDRRRGLSLQNTVRNEDILASRFAEVAGAVVRIGGDIATPGIVEARDGRRVELGLWPDGEAAWLAGLVPQLVRAGVGAVLTPDIVSAKFTKLVLNVDSALTALADLGVNQVGGRESVTIRRRLRDEALAVAAAEELDIPLLPAIEETAVPAAPSGRSSTWNDLETMRGRTETPWINGHIVTLGARHGIPTPANSVLDELMSAAVASGAKPGSASPQQILTEIERRITD